MTTMDGNDAVMTAPEVEIPEAATQLRMWFRNTDTSGCEAFDSASGANFHFEIG